MRREMKIAQNAAHIQLSVKHHDFVARRQNIIARLRLEEPQEDEVIKLI